MQLQSNESPDCQNVRTLTGSELRKRRGYDNLNATAISSTWTNKTSMTATKDAFPLFQIYSFLLAVGGASNSTNYKYTIKFDSWETKTVVPSSTTVTQG